MCESKRAADNEQTTESSPCECEDCGCEPQTEDGDQQKDALWDAERQELVNKALRLQADFANYKRRKEVEMQQIKENANHSLLLQLLPVIDNLERALAATNDDSSSLARGVKMVYQQLQTALQKEGLEEIPSVGEPFDPNVHEAIQMEGDGGDDLLVTAELQKGYALKGKVLRVSMVQVGTPEETKEEENHE